MFARIAAASVAVVVSLIILVAVAATAIVGAIGKLLTSTVTSPVAASADALKDIPATYLVLYQRSAATCPGLPWTVLAAVGKVETDHGRDPIQVSSAGAVGPMQFLPATWTGQGAAGSPWNPPDAIQAAADKLCQDGARGGRDIRGALFAYNHAEWYVTKVLDQAATYAAPAGTAPQQPGAAAAIAIAFAQAQIGTPYVWGGDGPSEGGFDCSGLTKAAYAAAGITIPRVAQDQYAAGPKVPPGAPLFPGDLVFYGTTTNIHHVGLYIGNGLMVDAPYTGALVRTEPYRRVGDDYYGATRPAA
ncbi:C40 family peptidase [Yinghuangia soli]|uniref:Bifunctional lytic transglycosylase/C40 family peptidase n=1 Tax=Yinghuangia soli TaxID=2908204 RepID=A0AA41U2X7_9ACTN|nr:bifunctional lytic transglycosylase/C40 family peptidase [Yinghuangia soli]MCF2531180.1 bifunctional lytic transglycosylase/C40 family peptidase [Yinghuangia soli]